MATGATTPNQRFEASLTVGTLVHLVLHAQDTTVGPTWHIADPNNTGGAHPAAHAGSIEEAKDVAVAVANAHARHVLQRASSAEAIPAIAWHPV